jgi:hypothetical protein
MRNNPAKKKKKDERSKTAARPFFLSLLLEHHNVCVCVDGHTYSPPTLKTAAARKNVTKRERRLHTRDVEFAANRNEGAMRIHVQTHAFLSFFCLLLSFRNVKVSLLKESPRRCNRTTAPTQNTPQTKTNHRKKKKNYFFVFATLARRREGKRHRPS